MITFDDLQPGAALGQASFVFTQDLLDQWCALYPDDRAAGPHMPAAMVVMVMMRAYTEVMHDRPPGNIHAGQKFRIARLPALHEQVKTRLTCMGKELKRERRWVTFSMDTVDAADTLLFRGEMTTIWAA